jgi:membrane-bound metal-dependent hydrolase YbcI (DUF457 family)
MPGGKTHMAIGVGVGLGLGALLPSELNLLWKLGATVALTTVGALAPDLDIADNELEELGRSEGRRSARRLWRRRRHYGFVGDVLLTLGGMIVWTVGEIVSRALEVVAWSIQRVTTHRGLTHSLLALVFVLVASVGLSTLLTATRNTWWGVAFTVGWLSHLLADGMTFSGLRLLHPFSEERFWFVPRGLRFRVGTWPDGLIGAVAPVIGFVVLLIGHGLFDVLADAMGG